MLNSTKNSIKYKNRRFEAGSAGGGFAPGGGLTPVASSFSAADVFVLYCFTLPGTAAAHVSLRGIAVIG